MIEPSSLVGSGPIGRPVAPPSVQLFLDRNAPPHRIDPGSRLLHLPDLSTSPAMAHDPEQRLLVPNVCLQRRDIEIADENGTAGGEMFRAHPGGHLVKEGELVREFRIDFRVGFVAARRNIEIMQIERLGCA